MAKIRELLNDNESVMAFDIDGVLAIMEWGEYNHFGLIDDDWKKACKEKVIEFGEDKVSKTMLKFIKDKDLSRMHVITMVYGDREGEFKKVFAKKYYGIPEENFYTVSSNKEKVEVLSKSYDKVKVSFPVII